jgi:DNA mismatch repair protein MutS2
MLTYSVKKLEFDEIKKMLSEYCQSDYGRYELELMRFMRNKEDADNALFCVDEAYKLLSLQKIIFDTWFNVFEEIKRSKLKNTVLSALDLYKAARTLKTASKAKDFFLKQNTPNINKIAQDIRPFEDITSDILSNISKEGLIFDKASKELYDVRQLIRSLKTELEDKLEAFIRRKENQHFIQEFIVTQRENRYVIPVKKDHKGKIKGIVLDTSNSGETLFIEPERIVEKNNRLIELVKQEKQEEYKILKRLSSYLTKHQSEIKESLRAFGRLDLIVAKASFAGATKSSRPVINDEGYWDIKKAYHPILGRSAVPIDISIGKDFYQLIITGPNTGGKTVSLKTLGLLTLMALSGMYIPADDNSIISIVDTIFLDIGDEQSIQQNLSTFSGHIKRILKILKTAGDKSLVLIDELGAGTDPADGAALGVSVLERLLEKKTRVVVTTHFEQIKNYAYFNSFVETASMEFDVQTLTPKYRLLMGISGKSDALLIAGKLGLDKGITDRAKSLQSRGMFTNEELFAELNKEKMKYIELTSQASAKLKDADKKLKDAAKKEEELRNLERELKSKEIFKAIDEVNEARKELLNIRKRLKDKKLDEEELKKETAGLENAARKLYKKSEEKEKKVRPKADINNLKPGDRVILVNLNKQGIIHETHSDKNMVTVSVGSIKIKTDISEIEVPTSADNYYENKKEPSFMVTHNIKKPSLECHVRGMRADEAMRNVEEYIEGLIVYNIGKGRIVHGKGEGILREIIHEYLKDHSSVDSFKLAHSNEGGWGVTEVFLKHLN